MMTKGATAGAVVLVVAACTKAPAPTTSRAMKEAPNAKDLPAQLADEALERQGRSPGMERRPRFGEAAVYLDGKSIGVLRALELPPSLKAKMVPFAGGRTSPRYPINDYLRSIGVDPAKVRAVHFYGGSRVAPVSGDEIRRIGERMTFSFCSGDRGKARVEWPREPVDVPTTIDMLSALTIYVDKDPPKYDRKQRALVDENGTPIEGVPFAPMEQGKGTRIYVDGALVATMKRKALTNDIVVPDGSAHARFSFAQYLAKVGVDTKHAREVDFVAGDDLFRRMSAKDWSAEKDSLAFTLPARSQGQAVVQSGEHHNKVSAVQLFVRTAPPARTVTDAAEFDPAEGSQGGGGGGGNNEEL